MSSIITEIAYLVGLKDSEFVVLCASDLKRSILRRIAIVSKTRTKNKLIVWKTKGLLQISVINLHRHYLIVVLVKYFPNESFKPRRLLAVKVPTNLKNRSMSSSISKFTNEK
ncbi:hypothetical protein C1H46_023154 [Malus baccata]|uniref:Uncharacterized protein n=1 Tax=Malus baccata TaxID=106549 RepID=A0A540LXS8_MALBA|nr:hypothetical protein C1H46_023154 [Malus baccata]